MGFSVSRAASAAFFWFGRIDVEIKGGRASREINSGHAPRGRLKTSPFQTKRAAAKAANGGHAPRGCLKASPSKTKRVTVKAKRHMANEHGLNQPDKFVIMVNCAAARKR